MPLATHIRPNERGHLLENGLDGPDVSRRDQMQSPRLAFHDSERETRLVRPVTPTVEFRAIVNVVRAEFATFLAEFSAEKASMAAAHSAFE